ncbi:hypothetical protein OKW37_005034 [Paraburkholderia sp. MM5482-R2]
MREPVALGAEDAVQRRVEQPRRDRVAEPMSGEFRIVFDEISYGVSISEALTNLATRVPIRDLRYFVIAVVIQRETGGNLAEVLDGITALIRDRFKLFDKVRVLAAEDKMSAWVLGLLPFGCRAWRVAHDHALRRGWIDMWNERREPVERTRQRGAAAVLIPQTAS